MSQIRQQQAYERGARTAHLWKKFKDSVLHWDRRCTAWANKKSLPLWVGHVPVIVALLGSLTIILLGGAAITGALLFVWAIAFILQSIASQSFDDSDSNSQATSEYRNGDQGFGLYSGPDSLVTSHRMDNEED
ncbi:Uncharacterised protein [Serratia quinivorans]|jgi:hypothetical protein|uniref:DUF3742 family protein n=1 Tax=Serratia quinivorans TaxID=137545 RepID=UPI00217B4071|nr:DUF3742 family protein [Serratia quinivorans]CAI2026097.1 Uncharacterised protein [Serratia quinivorans]